MGRMSREGFEKIVGPLSAHSVISSLRQQYGRKHEQSYDPYALPENIKLETAMGGLEMFTYNTELSPRTITFEELKRISPKTHDSLVGALHEVASEEGLEVRPRQTREEFERAVQGVPVRAIASDLLVQYERARPDHEDWIKKHVTSRLKEHIEPKILAKTYPKLGSNLTFQSLKQHYPEQYDKVVGYLYDHVVNLYGLTVRYRKKK
ncbi:MAG: hypothetical protein WC792_04325 [Candidatus Micrarchaeia archaeon]|jgi:hypothetical protein